jgi:hypothetical protein
MKLTGLAMVVVALSASISANAAPYEFRTIDIPGATSTELYGINNHGHIVGIYHDGGGQHGFLFDGSTVQLITHPSGADTTPFDINDSGLVVGQYGNLFSPRGFLLSNSTFQDIVFPGASWTTAHGINNAGTVVGAYGGPMLSSRTYGFILDGGQYKSVSPEGSHSALLYGINDAGLAVGDTRASPLTSGGFFFKDQTFSIIGFGNSKPTDLTSSGLVVGTQLPDPLPAYDSADGFIVENDAFRELRFPSAKSTWIEGVNDFGVIVGFYGDEANIAHGFVGIPVPEPANYLFAILPVLVLCLCAIRGRRRK